MSNEVAVQKPSYLANVNPMDNDFQPEIADIKVPNIILAQPASDAMKEENDGYIDGLKAGHFYNGSSRIVYGKTLHLIYVSHFKVYPVYKIVNGQKEWEENLNADQYAVLRGKVYSKESKGTLSPDRPDKVIGEHWKFVVINADDASFDFMYLTIKEGGLSDAKAWYEKIFALWKGNASAGIEPENPYTIVFEVPSYLKESKDGKNSSYQINGLGIKKFGYATEDQYKRAIATKDSIKSLSSTESSGEY